MVGSAEAIEQTLMQEAAQDPTGLVRVKISRLNKRAPEQERMNAAQALTYIGFLALQLHECLASESMGDHGSEVMGCRAHRSRRHWSYGRLHCGM